MVNLAINSYAFLYLLGVALVALLLIGIVAFFTGRAIRRRLRTRAWTPQIADHVISRRTGTHGTIDQIDGQRLSVGYFTPNNLAKNHYWTDRKGLFFDYRPARR